MMKITQICVLIFLFCVGYTSKAQVASYTFTHQIGIFTPNSTSATNVAAVEADSGISTALPIGFNFVYGAGTYTEFFMSSNGFISLGAVGNTLTTNNLSTANASQRPIIAPLWDDLDGRATVNSNDVSKASYEVSGVAPNRVLTVEWLNWEWNYGSTDPVISFQVKLYETTNIIEFVYRNESGSINGTGSASIGINDATGSGSGTYLNLNSNLTTPTVTSTSAVTNISTKPTTNQVFRFTPPACLYAGSITVSNIGFTSATLNLSVPASVAMDFYITDGTAPTSSTVPTGTVSVNGTSLPLTNLTAATSYTIYVKYPCAAIGNTWVYASRFDTPCPIYSNFSENFDNISTGSPSKTGANYPDCWSYIDSTTTGYGYVVASNPQSSPRVYRLYRANTASGASSEELVLVSPPTDNLGNGAKQLRFSIRSYSTTTYNSKLEILSMPDPTTTTGATVLATINNNNDRVWAEYV